MNAAVIKKNILGIVLIACLCFVFFSVNIYQKANNDNIISYNLDVELDNEKSSEEKSKTSQYADYLSQVVEEQYMGVDGVESADAIVSYDESSQQYSIELSLQVSKELTEEEVAFLKSALGKNYARIEVTINGEPK